MMAAHCVEAPNLAYFSCHSPENACLAYQLSAGMLASCAIEKHLSAMPTASGVMPVGERDRRQSQRAHQLLRYATGAAATVG